METLKPVKPDFNGSIGILFAYSGPMHVLELADKLSLPQEQGNGTPIERERFNPSLLNTAPEFGTRGSGA